MPLIVFCTNAGPRIGLGHLRRCLTLATALRERGATVRFVVNDDSGLLDILGRSGFEAAPAGKDGELDGGPALMLARQWNADVLIFDSYAIRAESLIDLRVPAIAVIDDLAAEAWTVDLVINGAADAERLPYRTPRQTRLLLGAQFALLREEFASDPNRSIRDKVQRVLISVGGMDQFGLTSRLIEWTRLALTSVSIDVIAGPFFSANDTRALEELAGSDEYLTLHREPTNIRDLMLNCDIAVTAGGQTTYELAATGTPSVSIRMFDNQTGNLQGLSAKGALVWVGDVDDADIREKVSFALRDLATSPERRKALSRAGRLLVDGRGAERVAEGVLKLLNR